MRILNIETINPTTKDKQTFDFATAVDNEKVLVAKFSVINKLIEYCFVNDKTHNDDVKAYIECDSDNYILSRQHGEDNIVTTLKKVVDNKKTTVARGVKVYEYLEKLTGAKMSELIAENTISKKGFEAFGVDLRSFGGVGALLDVSKGIQDNNMQLKQKSLTVKNTLIQLSKETNISVSKQDIEDITVQMSQTSEEIDQLKNKLAEYQTQEATTAITSSIMTELADAQQQYDTLKQDQERIEEMREFVKLNDQIAGVLPKIKYMDTLEKAIAELTTARAGIVKELEWQENEYSSVTLQLEEKQRQSALIVDKKSKIEVINQELETMAQLYKDNKLKNEQLLELTDQEQRLSAEKVLFKNKITSVENRINEIKKSINSFNVPSHSISELLESTRIDVKVDEINSQLDKLRNELSIKDSQIAEKESNLVVQVKRFKSVAQLDFAASPVKAKDTILQVLDIKYNKLNNINTSLKEKHRNFERALEDYRYRILQLETSKSILQGSLDKAVESKQLEFKREVYNNSQRSHADKSELFAVEYNMDDLEIGTIRQDMVKRELDRDVLLERANMIVGKLEEISRQIDINSAEMATLSNEKSNINNRYAEIVNTNRNESVFNYLKALESGNGTKYLLDVQQDAVVSEAELTELKKSADSIRNKISSLQSRLRYLEETQEQLRGGDSMDNIVATNDKIKEQLADIGDRLSASYEQHRAITEQLEDVESKLMETKANIIELSKSIAVNSQQIETCTAKAKRYADNDNLEEALSTFKYDVTDVESERVMLTESRKIIEKELFKKRLELEKYQYILTTKQEELAANKEEVQLELNIQGVDLSKFDLTKLSSVEAMRTELTSYDHNKTLLAERIDSYYAILSSHQPQNTVTVGLDDILAIKTQLVNMNKLFGSLEKQRQQKLEQYLIATNNKIRYAVVATEADSLSQLSQAISHNEIVSLLVQDKIKDILINASRYMKGMTDTDCVLSYSQDQLHISIDNVPMDYSSMDISQRFAVYLSMLLAMPCSDHTDGRWLIVDEKLPVDKGVISDMLNKVGGVSFLSQYNATKGAQQ